jgi:hypothetical protein
MPRCWGVTRRLNGTPEFAYGVTDWWELGLYLPFAVQNQQFLSNGFKLRTLFVSPHAEQHNFFYGVNFEFSYEMSKFAQTRFAMEVRPSSASAMTNMNSSSTRSSIAGSGKTVRSILRRQRVSLVSSAKTCSPA